MKQTIIEITILVLVIGGGLAYVEHKKNNHSDEVIKPCRIEILFSGK